MRSERRSRAAVPAVVAAIVGLWLSAGLLGAVPGQAADSSWTAVTWANSYSGTAAFRKDANGWVHFKGTIIGTGAYGNTFVMPTGYRPEADSRYGPTGQDANEQFDVDASGNASVNSYSGATLPNGHTVYLDGFSYYSGPADACWGGGSAPCDTDTTATASPSPGGTQPVSVVSFSGDGLNTLQYFWTGFAILGAFLVFLASMCFVALLRRR